MFESVHDNLLASISNLDAIPVAIDPEYATVKRVEKAGELSMTTRFYDTKTSGQIRYVLIRSAKINIVNLFFFPAANVDLPVYAMEMVILGKKPIVAVIDAPCFAGPINTDRVAQMFSDLRNKFKLGQNDSDMPDWYADSRSGWDIFLRPDALEDLSTVVRAQNDLWLGFCNLVSGPNLLPAPDHQQHNHSLMHYKAHHAENSPGRSFLSRSFGDDWTNNYLSDILFG